MFLNALAVFGISQTHALAQTTTVTVSAKSEQSTRLAKVSNNLTVDKTLKIKEQLKETNIEMSSEFFANSKLGKQNITKSVSLQLQEKSNPAAGDVVIFARQKAFTELEFNQNPLAQSAMVSRWYLISGDSRQGQSVFGAIAERDKCYICDRWRYMVLLFSREHTDRFQPVTDLYVIKLLQG